MSGHPTVHAAFAAAAARHPEKPFLNVLPETAAVYDIPAGEITYGEAAGRIEGGRQAFERAGYGPGHRVALLVENRPDFILTWFALNALGASVVPVNPDLRSAELEYLLSHSGAVLAVAIAERVESLRLAAEAAGVAVPVITLGEEPPRPLGVSGGSEAAAASPGGSLPPSAPRPAAPPPTLPSPPQAGGGSAREVGPGSRAAAKGASLAAPAHPLPPRSGGEGRVGGGAAGYGLAGKSEAPGPFTECALLYTSGTTGRPKGCVLPNEYFLMAGEWYAGVGGLCALREGTERMLTPLPVFHMNAMAYSTMAMVAVGGCLTLLDRFHPKSWWESVRASRATIVHYLGVMPPMLMSAPESPADREHAVRFGFGAGVDRGLHAGFERRFGFPLIEAWAMTETGAGAVIAASHEPRHVGTSCFGRPTPGIETRIVDDDGAAAAAGEPGELLVRRAGPSPRQGFFARYLKDEAATEEAWRGGWFHTGDVVRAGPDGSLHFVDRRKNVIRRSGENISAVEVESVLLQHPGVRAVAVAASPDPLRGDEVLACVVPAEPLAGAADRERAARDIVAWCLSRLAYYKAPGYVAFVDALPLTSTQKIQRGELKALAASVLPGEACVDTRSLKKRQAA